MESKLELFKILESDYKIISCTDKEVILYNGEKHIFSLQDFNEAILIKGVFNGI